MTKPIYIEVSAKVRYWEDAAVNGLDDEDGSLIPLRTGDLWQPVIRLADGVVMDWPAGTVADIHYKVCDQGQYWLQDADRKRVARWAGWYVPSDALCPGGEGWGDYIIMMIGADGVVEKWRPDIEIVGRVEDGDEGWLAMSAGGAA
jgi:hypothetical protein